MIMVDLKYVLKKNKVTYKDKVSKKCSFSEVYDLHKSLLKRVELIKK